MGIKIYIDNSNTVNVMLFREFLLCKGGSELFHR